jgi:hypothetical protein
VNISEPDDQVLFLIILEAWEAPVAFGSIETYSRVELKQLAFIVSDVEKLLKSRALVYTKIRNERICLPNVAIPSSVEAESSDEISAATGDANLDISPF